MINFIMQRLKALKSHQGFMKYFKNTSWLFGEKILRMIAGLFVGIWVARYLGPEQFGLFSYAQSFVGLFTAIATLGLDGIVVRELLKDESRRDDLIGAAFWLKLLGALGVLIVLAIAVNFTSNDNYTNSLVFIIASATIFQSFNVVDMYFQSKVLSKYIVYANVISLFISSIVKIALILNEAPLIAFAWVILFDSFILASGFIYFYLKNRRHSEQTGSHSVLDTESSFAWKFNKSTALSLLKDSWPLILSGILISIYMKIDQVMIKEMMNAEAVGQYAAAVGLSEAWYFIPMVIASSLFPAIINAKKQSEELYYARLQKLYNLMVWLAIAIALPMTFLSDWVVHFLYGEQYSQAGSVLMIHIWTGVFVFFASIWSKHMIANNNQKIFIQFDLLSTFFNILLNLIFIPKIGIIGAAIATAFSIPITYMVFFFLYKEQKLTIVHFLKALLLLSIFKKTRS
jgi:O-antigen/teichoic acid export membrane protein